MFKRALRAAVLAGVALYVLPSIAQEKTPDLVITPNKQPQSVQQIGSSITVITQDEIEKQGNKSLRDILDGQPGLLMVEAGGPGGLTSYYMRGTETRHTLVLVDGLRVNDPTTTAGEVDLSIVPPQLIERIEIVRGPQSALYGSDAIGGIINIITKKGQKGPPQWTFRGEGGSYGTFSTKLSVTGATEDLNYAFVLGQHHSDGFKRYGFRVNRLSGLNTNGSDPLDRLSGSGKVSKRVNDWLTLETGFDLGKDRLQYDKASGTDPLEPKKQRGYLNTAYQRAIAESGPFRTTLTTFESQFVRRYSDLTPSTSNYEGSRYGAELQNDTDLKQYGKVTLGTRYESERAKTDYNSATYTSAADNRQRTASVYALYQISMVEKLHLSAGVRSDHVSTSGQFGTYRLTSAYDLTSTTRIHASYGTGVKVPSLYQLKDPDSGNADLLPETSRGYDVGIDQVLLGGDARMGATWFSNRIRNLITADAPNYIYYNVSNARSSGVEFSADYNLMPSFAKLKGAYTLLETADAAGLSLYRRPRHSGRVSVAFTPHRDLTIEPVLRLVGQRVDGVYNSSTGDTDRLKLAAYARFDVLADYKVSDRVSLFARAENLTNAKYEDVYNYGTAGRSAYAGLQMTW